MSPQSSNAVPYPADSDHLDAADDDIWGRRSLDGREAGFGGYLVDLGGCVGLDVPDGDWSVALLFSGLEPGLNGGLSADGTTLNYLGHDVTLGSLVEVGGGWVTLSEQDADTISEFYGPVPDACLPWTEPFFVTNTVTIIEQYPPGAPVSDVPADGLASGDRPPDYGELLPPAAFATLDAIWMLAKEGDTAGLAALAAASPGFAASCCGSDGSAPLTVWIDEFGGEAAFIRALRASLDRWPTPTDSGVRWGAGDGQVWMVIGYDGTWTRGSRLGGPATQ